jgi:hypothetical protein
MGKILSLLLGLAVISYMAYRTLTGSTTVKTADGERATPHQQLENVREAAKNIEIKQDQHGADVDQKTEH